MDYPHKNPGAGYYGTTRDGGLDGGLDGELDGGRGERGSRWRERESSREGERERKLRDAPETTENINQVNFTGNIPVSGIEYKYERASLPPSSLPFAGSPFLSLSARILVFTVPPRRARDRERR